MKYPQKEALINALTDITDSVTALKVVEKLNEIGAISPFWTSEMIPEVIDEEFGLPDQFKYVGPLYQGYVAYIERDGFYGYVCQQNIFRVHDKSKRKLAKKIKKYGA